ERAGRAGERWRLGSAAWMAASAFGDGPSGFSLEASLIEPVMPISRSSSSIGFPGGYGVSVRTHSGTRLRTSNIGSLRAPCPVARRGVGAEDAEPERASGDLRQRPPHPRFRPMPLQIDREVVFPRPLVP